MSGNTKETHWLEPVMGDVNEKHQDIPADVKQMLQNVIKDKLTDKVLAKGKISEQARILLTTMEESEDITESDDAD